MDVTDANHLQILLDTISYPTHATFRVANLTPDAKLGARCERLMAVAPFLRERTEGALLDIGASFGFFSLTLADRFAKVVAVEPNQPAAAVMRSAARLHGVENLDVVTSSFIDFNALDDEFEVVLCLNVFHYLFQESGGTEFVYKLAGVCSRWLILEGPIDDRSTFAAQQGAPFRDPFPSLADVVALLRPYFDVECDVESAIPDRRLMVLKRRHRATEIRAPHPDEFCGWEEISYPNRKRTSTRVLTDGKRVVKFYPFRVFPWRLINALAERDPRIVPVTRIYTTDGLFCGYEAPFVPGVRADVRSAEHCALVKAALLALQTRLSRVGVLFYDIGSENFLIDERRGEVFFVDLKTLIEVPHHATIHDRARHYRAAAEYGITPVELSDAWQRLPRAHWDIEAEWETVMRAENEAAQAVNG